MVTTVGRQRRRRPSDEIRATVLDAAEACFSRYGIQQTTMQDIVAAAGVRRATLYRHAGSRDDLLIAVTLREIDRVFIELDRYVASRGTVADVIVDGTCHAIELVRQSPLLSGLFASAPSLLDNTISEPALASLFERLHEFVAPVFEPAQAAGLLRRDLNVPDAVEYLLRTIHSQITFEVTGRRSESERHRYLRMTLLPVFVPDHLGQVRREEFP
ncbi:MAG: TetR/AcrR family transcriptional regulator [Acidimicrobiales bacterium]